MSYGSVTGVSYLLEQYDELIAGGSITTEMVEAFLVEASGDVDAIVGKVATVPMAAPPQVVTNVTNKLAVCRIITRMSLGKDPDEIGYVNVFCKDPLEMLENAVKSNPAIFTGAAGASTMSSNTLNQDRKFTMTETSGDVVTSTDAKTMDDW